MIKKLILIIGILFICYSRSFAIDYPLGIYHNIFDSGTNLYASADSYYDGHDSFWYNVQDSGTYYLKSIACLYNTGTDSNDQLYRTADNSLRLFFTGGNLFEEIVDIDGITFFSGVLATIKDQTSLGAFPNTHVICVNFDFIYGPPYHGANLFSQNAWIYNNTDGKIVHKKEYLTGSSYPNGVELSSASLSPQYFGGAWRYDFPGDVSTENSPIRQKILSQFLTGTTLNTNDVYDPLGYYYGSQGITEYSSSSGSTGSGTDYYAECSTVDITEIFGCYVKATWLTVKAWIVGLFPNIEWTGNASTCVTNSGGTSSGLTTPVSYSGSSKFIQNIVNMTSLILPFPPPEGTNVCLIGGSDIWNEIYGTGLVQIHYGKYINNDMRIHSFYDLTVFDMMILVIVGFCWINLLKPAEHKDTIVTTQSTVGSK